MTAMFAGSAIAQNAGRLANIDEWSPTEKKRKWLLIRGASSPPKDVATFEQRTVRPVASNFLPGTTKDLMNMEDFVGDSLNNTVSDLGMKKNDAMRHIDTFLKLCAKQKYKPMLYYTGHGEFGTGNWCFSDGTIGVEEIKRRVPGGCIYPTICSDACYSGAWAHYCFRRKIEGFECLAACREEQSTVDNPGTGGQLTLYMTGHERKLPNRRPKTEPLFSRGAEIDNLSDKNYLTVEYADFIECHTSKGAKTLIWQSVHKRCMLAVFDNDILLKNKKKYFSCSNYQLYQQMVVSYEGFNVFSLSCDQHNGKFYVYMMKNYGKSGVGHEQKTIEVDREEDFSAERNYSITSCTAGKSHYFLVLTQGVKPFDGYDQEAIFISGKTELNAVIEKQRDNGMILTSICYNVEKREYLIVTTASQNQQQHAWFKPNKNRERIDWTDNLLKTKDFVYTIWFEDPSDEELLVVMTSDDYRSGYKCKLVTLCDS